MADSGKGSGGEGDERRQVLIFRTDGIIDPGSRRRPPSQLKTRMQELRCGVVIDVVCADCFHKTEIIDELGSVREKVTDPGAALAVLVKGTDRFYDGKRRLSCAHGRKTPLSADRWRQFLPVHL